jgi:Ca2+-binding RTX toxin-like protein
MATVTGGVFALRMDKMKLANVWKGTVTVRTDDLLRVDYGNGYHTDFQGSGLTYHSGGAVMGGKIKGIHEEYQGLTVFSIRGTSVSAAFVYGRALARDTEGFKEALLAKADKVTGTRLNDHLEGLAGNDTIKAGAGRDTIEGGAGNDVLYGGQGRDSFVFDTEDYGTDRIKDFSTREDKIWIDVAGFNKSGLGAASFVSAAQAQDVDDFVIYNPATGDIYFDRDGNGADAQIILAKVQPGLVLSAAHFLFI